MKLKSGCNAAWYEINISSADNRVSACCYYSGETDSWDEEVLPLEHYWNSPNMQAVRQLNSVADTDLAGGCSNCFFFNDQGKGGFYFPDFFEPYSNLTPEQRQNWLTAVEDYQSGRTHLQSTPLRFYINFGFGCNLSCTMCHQVPRRGLKEYRQQVSADILTKWKSAMKAALDIVVIGGEPFVLPEATKFIYQVIADPDLENVRLIIHTNGTLLHQHLDKLAQKRKLAIAVSLDTIGKEFEQIRVGAKWEQIERNILDFKALGERLGYSWFVGVPCLLLKTNIPRLYDFAKWTIDHDIQPGFHDFTNASGIEKTYEQENVIAHPELLREVPDWEKHFTSTINLLRNSQYTASATQLENLYAQIHQKLVECASERVQLEQLQSEQATELQLAYSRIAELESIQSRQAAELQLTRNRIEAMESSKFWQMRETWVRLKQTVGIPGE